MIENQLRNDIAKSKEGTNDFEKDKKTLFKYNNKIKITFKEPKAGIEPASVVLETKNHSNQN